ncbi:adhesion G-protein coupled receptor G6-like isoform X2 [Amphiura filiformis]|uniref:adhesion G-protein coupled receptor G6-like isoform X2 n=1 Tax=Amphiura filiformis TaxID=82378 RepID=UPI003B212AFE
MAIITSISPITNTPSSPFTTNLAELNTSSTENGASVFLYVSYMGWALSITSLLVTVATYLTLRSLRNKTTGRLLICLSLSLLCLYVVFAAGVRRENVDSNVKCNLVAALLHYFTLTSVAWMSVESYTAYLWIVQGRKSHGRRRRSQGCRYFVISCLVAWGLPFLIVGVIEAIDRCQYYKIHENECPNNNANIRCFMVTPSTHSWKTSWAFIFFNLTLIFIVLLCNFVFLTVVAHELVFGRDFAPRYGDRDHDKKRKQAILRTVNDFVMSILLVLTWLFGTVVNVYSSKDGIRYAFAMLFCLCYFLQGFLVFLLYCVRLEEVRNLWKECFYKVRYLIGYLREPLLVLLVIAIVYLALDVVKVGQVFKSRTQFEEDAPCCKAKSMAN